MKKYIALAAEIGESIDRRVIGVGLKSLTLYR